jgi:DNA-binding transcriptional LysR family regulator
MVLKQLMYVAALARERHFGRAAKSCHVSQPTLSAAVRQLEQELGAPIVRRGQRFNGFTPEGESVLEHAKRIIAECSALRQDLTEVRGGLSGRLRLGAIPSALPIVSMLTAPLHAKFPAVMIAVMSLTSQQIQRGIDDLELDAGLTYLDNDPLERVRAVRLYREEYVLLAPEDGPFGGRATVTWAEAARDKLCLMTPDMQNRRIIDGIFRSVGETPRPNVETNAIFNLWSYVSSGHGSSIVPKSLLQVFGIPEGTCAPALVEPKASRTVGLIISDRDLPSPLARTIFTIAGSLDLEATLTPRTMKKGRGRQSGAASHGRRVARAG